MSTQAFGRRFANGCADSVRSRPPCPADKARLFYYWSDAEYDAYLEGYVFGKQVLKAEEQERLG